MCPSFPSIPLKIPDAISDPKALLMMLPQYRIPVLSPNSSRLYHLDSKNYSHLSVSLRYGYTAPHTRAPGKNAASTKPRKKRVKSAPTKLKSVAQQVMGAKEIERYPLMGDPCDHWPSDSMVSLWATYQSGRRSYPR